MSSIEFRSSKISNSFFKEFQRITMNSLECDRNTGIIVEDGCMNLIFVEDNTVSLELANSQVIELPKCSTFNKPSPPYKFKPTNILNLFAVKIQPWAASLFIKRNNNAVIDLEKLHPGIHNLHKRIFNKYNEFDDMISCVEEFFNGNCWPNTEELEVTKRICELIYEADGNISIKYLIRQMPFHRQKLNRIFKERTFNSIKEFSTHVRIRSALEYKVKHPKESLTKVGTMFGYFDQSHFIRDIKKSTGVSPRSFLKNKNIFKQQLIS